MLRKLFPTNALFGASSATWTAPSALTNVLQYSSVVSREKDALLNIRHNFSTSHHFQFLNDARSPAVSVGSFIGATRTSSISGFSSSSPKPWTLKSTASSELPFAYRGLSISVNPEAPKGNTVPSNTDSVEVSDSKTTLDSTPKVESDYWGIVPKKYFKEDGTEWPWHSFRPSDTYHANVNIDLDKHFKPKGFEDWAARMLVKAMRVPADLFFQKRYGCRAMMLETVAAVPGMVAGMLLHLKSLRRFEHTGGWIRALLDEAENERMHLMTFMEVAKPNFYERMLVLAVQGVFFNLYFLVYLLKPRMAHRVVGYLEEEAIHSYTEYLKELDAGRMENVPAPQIAIDYWRLPQDATLRDVVLVVRADEANHRDVNHFAANVLREGKSLKEQPAPVDYH